MENVKVRKMKKRLALLLAMAMIFTLAACGKKPAEEKADKPSEKVENKADTEKKDEKKEEKKDEGYKAIGMVDVHGEGIFTTPEGIEELSEERLKEIYEYFDKNMEETQGMTYEEVEEYIGTPGAHFVDHDEENENGELTKSIFWYSPDHFLSMVFTADKDSPDDFGLTETWAMPKAIDEDEVDPQSESEEKPTVAYSDETGMVDVHGKDMLKRPEGIEILSQEKMQEVVDYFSKNNSDLADATYAEIESHFGVAGAHFVDFDEVDGDDITKYVMWYSEENSMAVSFIGKKDSPDDLKILMWSSSLAPSEQ